MNAITRERHEHVSTVRPGGITRTTTTCGDIRPTLRQVPTNLALAEQIIVPRDKGWSADPVLTLGGPIMKDKAWFFVGYGPQYRSAERTVTWVNPGTNPPTQTFTDGDPNVKALNYNITSQINPKLRARLTGSNERQKGGLGLPGIEPNGTSTSNAASFNPRPPLRLDQFQDSYSGVLDWVASNKVYVNLTGAYFNYGSHNAGADYYHGTRRTFSTTNVNLLDVPVSLQRVSGFADNNTNSFTVQDDYSRINISSDATWFAHWKGDHSIKVGGLYEKIGNIASLGQQNPNIAFNWGGTYATPSAAAPRPASTATSRPAGSTPEETSRRPT